MLKKAIKLIKGNPFFSPLLFLIDLFLFSIDLLATIGSRKKNANKICIIKLDKLGDYILIRNFVHYLKGSGQYKTYQFCFIGNKDNQKFAEYLDEGLFDKIIWIDIYKYSSHPFYRFTISRKIYREGFQIVIAPTYARVFVLDDLIAFVTRARVRIGQVAHLVNIKTWERWMGNHFYTSLIRVEEKVIFEFERNREFFEKITGGDFSKVELQIAVAKGENKRGKYVIFMPGAADIFRQWFPENFSKVADYIVENKSVEIILCGAPAERKLGEKIKSITMYPEMVKNEIGVLKIEELFEVFSHASFIVSNETGAVHICAAMNKTVFCISNGNHFTKYTEYPQKLQKKVYYIYPPEMDGLMDNKDELATKFDFKSNLDINSIPEKKVIEEIAAHLDFI